MRKKILIGMSLLLIVGLLAGCGGVKQADYDAAKAQVTSLQSQVNAANAVKAKADANKALLQQFEDQVINAHNPNAMDNLVTANFKRYPSATVTLTLEQAKQRLAGLFAAFPDVHMNVENVIAEGDFVAARNTETGTQQGAFQGIPATGKQITVVDFVVMRIENGKIAEHWGGGDALSMLQQIGAVISAPK